MHFPRFWLRFFDESNHGFIGGGLTCELDIRVMARLYVPSERQKFVILAIENLEIKSELHWSKE